MVLIRIFYGYLLDFYNQFIQNIKKFWCENKFFKFIFKFYIKIYVGILFDGIYYLYYINSFSYFIQ